MEKSSCSTSDDNDNDDGGESGTQKLTRAQRKRLRKKKLKEDASRRGKIIGPLLPSSNDDGDVGVRQNAAENVGAASDKSGEESSTLLFVLLHILYVEVVVKVDFVFV